MRRRRPARDRRGRHRAARRPRPPRRCGASVPSRRCANDLVNGCGMWTVTTRRRAVRRDSRRSRRDQRLDAAGRRADGDDLAVRLIGARLARCARRAAGAAGLQPRAGGRLDACRQVVERVRDGRSSACRRNRPRRAPSRGSSPSRPRAVRLDTITTGNGRSRMTFSRNSSPSIFGISTSRVMTSGLSALIASRASSGSAAWPTTSMPGSRDSAARDQAAHGGGIVDDEHATGLHAAVSVPEPIGGDAGAAKRRRRRSGHALRMADVEPAARLELAGEFAPQPSCCVCSSK